MKYVANLYHYEVKDLKDVEDLYTIICDNEPWDTEEFETEDEAIAFVRGKRTKATKQNGYYVCKAWVAEPHPDVIENAVGGPYAYDCEVSDYEPNE